MVIKRPSVGLGIILMKQTGEVLLGKRKNAHGDGTWGFPGGHLEWMESLKFCAEREMSEETGFDRGINYSWREPTENISDAATNDFFHNEDKHYITLYVRAEYIQGKPEIMQRKKCAGWKWHQWNYLGNLNLFLPVRNLIKQGYDPFKLF